MEHPEEEIGKELFEYLLKNNIAIITLGHLNFEDDRLIQLAPQVEEARFTLLRRAYLQPEYSVEKFHEYLYRIIIPKEDESILSFLLELEGNKEKKKELIKYCKQYGDEKILMEAESVTISMEILESTDPEMIKKCYEKNSENPYILEAIAKNCYTPCEVLQNLKSVRNIKNASYIRKMAGETLKNS